MNELLSFKGRDHDIEYGDSSSDPKLKEFFADVDGVKALMQEIQQTIPTLRSLHEENRQATRAPSMKAAREKMETMIDKVTKTALAIKKKLQALDRSNAISRKQPGCGAGSATDKTRTNVTGALKNGLKDMMQEFQDLRSQIHEDQKEVVERRYYTVTGQKPDQEIVDHMLETGETDTIFRKAIEEQGRGQILDIMSEIQERHDAVKDIEKQLLELNQIFMDMASLVEAQGEELNDIEQQVVSANIEVEKGNVVLAKAREHQKNTRKWMCYGILLLIIIIAIIILIAVKPWNK